MQGVDQVILESHIRRLRELDREVGSVESRIALEASMDEDVALLMTLTGVSHFGALLLVRGHNPVQLTPGLVEAGAQTRRCPASATTSRFS